MPHQCTSCGRTFADGSKEMLSGCPDCGGNKFQFRPEGSVADADPDAADPTHSPDDGGLADAAARAGAAVRDRLPGSDPHARSPQSGPPSDAPSDPDPTRSPDDGGAVDAATHEDGAHQEDSAQADARTDVVSPDELPSTPPDAADAATDTPEDTPGADGPSRAPPAEESTPPEEPPDADGEVVEGPAPERPDLEELRAELNDQFESIRVVNPGEYELNLMELYDRQEYIISLQEDGRYVIEVPDTWADEE